MSKITRRTCYYCIWHQKGPMTCLSRCEWYKKTILELYWNGPVVDCDHYEQWHEDI